MNSTSTTGADVLRLDLGREVERIIARVRELVFDQLRRKGAVIGVSGGIDSSVVAYLCTRALGKERVLVLFTPEVESSPESLRLGRMVAGALGVPSFTEDITPILQAAGCYERRDAAIRSVIKHYGEGYKCKLVLPNIVDSNGYPVFSIMVQSPEGVTEKARLTAPAFLGVVAATNFKQRARKMMEYHYSDLYQYAVAGTSNRLECDQGFFVKNGDGACDFKPIAHLYKSQVYQLASYLEVPEEIQRRQPTTDTYSLQQSQEEFYFALPLAKMDVCLYGINNDIAAAEIANQIGMTGEQVQRVYAMIESRRMAARYLSSAPLLVEEVPGIT